MTDMEELLTRSLCRWLLEGDGCRHPADEVYWLRYDRWLDDAERAVVEDWHAQRHGLGSTCPPGDDRS